MDKQIIELLSSPNYKERIQGEYLDLLTRTAKLELLLMLEDIGALNFEFTCPVEMLEEQLLDMKEYLSVLIRRAKVEKVDLSRCTVIAVGGFSPNGKI